ncbi:HPF/RaiA family ribosome-associated protein [Methylocaldum sp.]|uniref:HPF/RaiA family ribosome-associated protein n=1 Tax=Methylocaldum sp. TaxID=1969727 RepID=UPI002D2DD0DC|nr:HPF/RaiA family ribosome-associated protein [Methylocaldum sp.]HYE37403.1 HPF/RaiA family ribosome-associated protein [Methylocaldum sp.]
MQIQFNTDSNIEGRDELARWVEDATAKALGHFGDRITRLEVHLSDINAHKSGQDDIRCLLEARPARRKPVAVSHRAGTIEQAVNGATEKLKRALDSTFSRLGSRQRTATFSDDSGE